MKKKAEEKCWLIKTIDTGCIAGGKNVSSGVDYVCHMEKKQIKLFSFALTTPAYKEHLHY